MKPGKYTRGMTLTMPRSLAQAATRRRPTLEPYRCGSGPIRYAQRTMSGESDGVDQEAGQGKAAEGRLILERMSAILAGSPDPNERSSADMLSLHGDLAHLREQFFELFDEIMDRRNRIIVRLHREGVPHIQIAESVGVTAQRIRDILAEIGTSADEPVPESAPASTTTRTDSRNYMVMAFHEAGESDSRIAELTGLSVSRIRAIIASHTQRSQAKEIVRVLHGHNVSADEIATAVGLTRQEVDEIIATLEED